MTDYIYHHGIKGMRWGIRRFQNDDGSLTPAGRERYSDGVSDAAKEVHSSKQSYNEAKKAYNKRPDAASTKAFQEASHRYNTAKNALSDEKAKVAMSKSKGPKSKHRQALEQKYMEKGLTQEEAAVQAFKRERTEKMLVAAAAVTAVAAASYVAYRHYDKTVDKIIPANTTLQRITNDSSMGVRDAFYASFTKSDNEKYRGMYGNTLGMFNRDVFEKKISIKDASGLKMASEKSAQNVLSELVGKDPDFKGELQKAIARMGDSKTNNVAQQKLVSRAQASLKAGKIDANVYQAFNLSLVDHETPGGQKLQSSFYDALKNKGYSAIMDTNDKYHSGFDSKKPVIVFDSSKVNVDSARKLTKNEIASADRKATNKTIAKQLVRTMAPGLGGLAAMGAASKVYDARVTRRKNDDYVKQYRKEHPGTKLSYNEIVKNYKG